MSARGSADVLLLVFVYAELNSPGVLLLSGEYYARPVKPHDLKSLR